MSEAKVKDDFFGDDETVTSDLPRYAINEADPSSETLCLQKVEGIYEDTQMQVIEGKERFTHRIKPREPIDGHVRILLWGNAQLDNSLPTLTPGSKVRITYKGTRNLSGGRRIKEIEVLFSAKAVRRANPYAKKVDANNVADETF